MTADAQRALRLLGLCRRAGALVIGMDAQLAALRRGGIRLLVLAGDASPATARRAEEAAADAGVPTVVLADRSTIGRALGREWVAVCGVTDAAFADGIQKAVPLAAENPDDSRNDRPIA